MDLLRGFCIGMQRVLINLNLLSHLRTTLLSVQGVIRAVWLSDVCRSGE